MPSTQMGSRGTSTVQTVHNVNLNTVQWMSIFWCHFTILLWWTLNTFLGVWGLIFLTLDAGPRPCVIIDTELARMVDELKRSDPASAIDLDKFCQGVDALRKNPSASWLRRPWSDIQQVIEKELPSGPLLKKDETTLAIHLKVSSA